MQVLPRCLAYLIYPIHQFHGDFVFFSRTHEPEGDLCRFDDALLSLWPLFGTFSSFLYVFFCFGIVNWSLTSSVNAILIVAAYIREVFLIDDVVVLFWGQCADKSASSLLG
jgi:hypothetical protein